MATPIVYSRIRHGNAAGRCRRQAKALVTESGTRGSGCGESEGRQGLRTAAGEGAGAIAAGRGGACLSAGWADERTERDRYDDARGRAAGAVPDASGKRLAVGGHLELPLPGARNLRWPPHRRRHGQPTCRHHALPRQRVTQHHKPLHQLSWWRYRAHHVPQGHHRPHEI
jgi:hypothetical protein